MARWRLPHKKRQKGSKPVKDPHHLVAQKVASVMDKYGVCLKQLCELAKITTAQLVGKKHCSLNAVGKCKNQKCTFDHSLLSNEDTNRYVQLLQPALENDGALANLKKVMCKGTTIRIGGQQPPITDCCTWLGILSVATRGSSCNCNNQMVTILFKAKQCRDTTVLMQQSRIL